MTGRSIHPSITALLMLNARDTVPMLLLLLATVAFILSHPSPALSAPAFNHIDDIGDSRITAERIRSATSVATHVSGDILVADLASNRVKRYSSKGEYRSSFFARSPASIAVGVSDDIYVTDLANDRVVRYDFTGGPIAMWGGRGESVGRFDWPSSIAVDSSGDVWVTDLVNSRFQRFGENGEFKGAIGSRGAKDGARFYSPAGIAVSDDGSVLVADTGNHRIQRFIPSTLDAIGVTYDVSWGTRGSAKRNLSSPESLALDGKGNVFVADIGNSRVQYYSELGSHITSIGRRGTGSGRFDYVSGVAVMPRGDLLVSDMDDDGDGRNDVIQRFEMVPRATSLRIIGNLPVVGLGLRAALRARLYDSMGRPVPGVPVLFQGRNGVAAPTDPSLVTGSDGSARTVFTPGRSGMYRAVFQGANGLAGSASRSVTIAVMYKASFKRSPVAITSGRKAIFSGRVRPARTGKRVVIQRYSRKTGAWRGVKAVRLRSGGTFRIAVPVTATKEERARFRLNVPGDTRNSAVVSRSVGIRIVPSR